MNVGGEVGSREALHLIMLVKELIEKLKTVDPNSIVCASEKGGRGGQVNDAYAFYVGTLGDFNYHRSEEEKDTPAVEISCGY